MRSAFTLRHETLHPCTSSEATIEKIAAIESRIVTGAAFQDESSQMYAPFAEHANARALYGGRFDCLHEGLELMP